MSFPTRKGIILSVEVMLAALLLFGAFLVASNLAGISARPPSALPLLRFYAADTLAQGSENGAWSSPVQPSGNDTATRALLDNLPAGVCAQVAIYANSSLSSNLRYSYVPSGCNLTIDLPVQSSYRSLVVWRNSSAYDFYWVRLSAYPRGGG